MNIYKLPQGLQAWLTLMQTAPAAFAEAKVDSEAALFLANQRQDPALQTYGTEYARAIYERAKHETNPAFKAYYSTHLQVVIQAAGENAEKVLRDLEADDQQRGG
jgi:hypothetical protein